MDVLKSHVRDLGGGLMVSRVLPGHPHQMVGPFIFFDQMGPVTVAPGRGIVHSERGDPESRKSARRMHGIQSWVALPKAREDAKQRWREQRFAAVPGEQEFIPLPEH
jgi:hypothetical protein